MERGKKMRQLICCGIRAAGATLDTTNNIQQYRGVTTGTYCVY